MVLRICRTSIFQIMNNSELLRTSNEYYLSASALQTIKSFLTDNMHCFWWELVYSKISDSTLIIVMEQLKNKKWSISKKVGRAFQMLITSFALNINQMIITNEFLYSSEYWTKLFIWILKFKMFFLKRYMILLQHIPKPNNI